MKKNLVTNILLIVVAILLIINLWATFSINRYQIVSRYNICRVDKLTGTYKVVVREPRILRKAQDELSSDLKNPYLEDPYPEEKPENP